METFDIRSVDEIDPQRIINFLERRWGSQMVVSRGKLHDAAALPGFFACHHERVIGLATYHIVDAACELVTLDSEVEEIGVGSALIDAVKKAAVAAGCHRLWLITTNDNLPALGFYQKRGFRITAVHANALEQSRQLKPQIPHTGLDGIPLRDEIELELPLTP
ncbi:MAG: GNAT family N-acetyltransferase [Ardenticatenaceae bacterium]|nr:GNAT family N-acetyltransferase [Ardenticatenaceae bacterium]MCB9446215.1 GNAT family N-acetyltransferase [Ardenticatenaceae bacterium]